MHRIAATLLFMVGCTPAAMAPQLNFGDGAVMTGSTTASPGALAEASDASAAVCVGEQHDSAAHHHVQFRLLEHMIGSARARGVKLALGMEMFRRPMQPALNAYFEGAISTEELRQTTGWDDDWGYGFEMYRPLIETARSNGVRIIGLNAHRELTKAVARRGLAGLPVDVRDSLPQLKLDDAEHRKFFWTIMGFNSGSHAPKGHQPGGHAPPGHMSPENFYTAQVIWDETMAESAASWLADPEPRQILIVAGNGHCHRTAIPNRVARRRPFRALSVLLRTRGEELAAHTQSDFIIETPPEPTHKPTHKPSHKPTHKPSRDEASR